MLTFEKVDLRISINVDFEKVDLIISSKVDK
jgi:hypothetical protein